MADAQVTVSDSTEFIEFLQTEDRTLTLWLAAEGIDWKVTDGALNIDTDSVIITTKDGDSFGGCYVYSVEEVCITLGVS